ncbi:MAG: VOC family protein [Thermomicrobia bacterium]|nr:VOC family protein [Thermomicrobia bacterium]
MATTQQTRPSGHEAADRDHLPSPFAALHHVALVTNDMKKTVAFYRDVLGSEVAMGHRLGRPGNERHYFITVAPNTVFAFFEFPDAEMPAYKDATLPAIVRRLSNAGHPARSSSPIRTTSSLKWRPRAGGSVSRSAKTPIQRISKTVGLTSVHNSDE